MRHTYDFARPALSCDTVVLCGGAGEKKVLLVRRGAEPFEGCWALPGGFVDEGEKPGDAALRELAEETGLVWEGELEPLGTFGDPGRDPRGWTVSAAYLAVTDECLDSVTAGDDACEARWFGLGEVPVGLAFDHDQILALAVARSRRA